MSLQQETEVNRAVDEYNNDHFEAYLGSLIQGSLKRPRATLADISGLTVANDNSDGGDDNEQ